MRPRYQAAILWLALLSACGGGGGSAPPTIVVPPAADTVTVYYLRADPSYDGWGLHLWGSALGAGVATSWNAPRMPDRIENGAAVFEVPVDNSNGQFNVIAHNGDLKSPLYDMSIVPATFGDQVWLVQDSVASLSGVVGTPFDNESAAVTALNALGNASSGLDLLPVAASPTDSGLPPDWADAAAFIEIYVRAYQDSDGDGVGDLQGLVSRLDYLQGLGVRGIWLMPVFESADNDHGYAVSDYRAIESDYGTMADFELLLAEAHARGIAVIVDYVMNHASSTNPLFLDATTGPANDKYTWFVWEDTHPSGWNTFSGDPWRNNGNGYYYGVFSPLMPDFNLLNPDVVEYHKDNLRFWLNRGVDGFRFDAVGVLFENGAADWNNQPENHVLLQELQALVSTYGKRFMVCEAPDDPPAYAATTSCGRAFAFQAPGAIFDSARNESVDPGLLGVLGAAAFDRMPLLLSNHDAFAGDRTWNQVAGDEMQYRLAAATYILAARNPFTYYGEEVGMANASVYTDDRKLRTPMSWTPDTVTAGFTTGVPFRDLSDNVATHNVMNEAGVGGSLLEYYRALLQLRVTYPHLAAGTITVQSGAGEPVLVFRREQAGSVAIVVINYAATTQSVDVDAGLANTSFDNVFGGAGQVTSDAGSVFTVSPPPHAVLVYVDSP